MAVSTIGDVEDRISSVKMNFCNGLKNLEMVNDVLQTQTFADISVQTHLHFLMSKCYEHFRNTESQLSEEIDKLSEVTEEAERNLLSFKKEMQNHIDRSSVLEKDVKRERELLHQKKTEELIALKNVKEAKSHVFEAETKLQAVKDSQSTMTTAAVVSLFVPVIGTFVAAPLLFLVASDMDAIVLSREKVLQRRQQYLSEALDFVLLIQNRISNIQEEIASITSKRMTAKHNISKCEQLIEAITHKKLFVNTIHSQMRKCLHYIGRVSGRAEALRDLTNIIYSLKQITSPLEFLLNQLHEYHDVKELLLKDNYTRLSIELLGDSMGHLAVQHECLTLQ